jgi:hypothetical protein
MKNWIKEVGEAVSDDFKEIVVNSQSAEDVMEKD